MPGGQRTRLRRSRPASGDEHADRGGALEPVEAEVLFAAALGNGPRSDASFDASKGKTIYTLSSTSTNGYVFRYLSNTNQVILESSSAFALGHYLILVDNTSAAAVADLANL